MIGKVLLFVLAAVTVQLAEPAEPAFVSGRPASKDGSSIFPSRVYGTQLRIHGECQGTYESGMKEDDLLQCQNQLKTVLKRFEALNNKILNRTQRNASNQPVEDGTLDHMLEKNRTIYRLIDLLRCQEIQIRKLLDAGKESAGCIPKGKLRQDGIALSDFHLPRTELVNRIQNSLAGSQFVMISSSAGTGKTSLLMLLSKLAPCVSISCTSPSFLWTQLKKYGIDVHNHSVSIPVEGPELNFILDDAQWAKHTEAEWHVLITGLRPLLPARVRFIISGTDPSTSMQPIVARYRSKDLRLSDDEADQLLKAEFGIPSYAHGYSALMLAMKRDCAGQVSALINAAVTLTELARQAEHVNESTMFAYFYSCKVTQTLRRCFGTDYSARDLNMLHKCLFGRGISFLSLSRQQQKVCGFLVKAGILAGTDELEFSSPMAARYFMRWLFPKRSHENPNSLKDLLIKVFKSLSASELRLFATHQDDFPSEATFQSLVMSSLCTHAKYDCHVCPELSRTFDPEGPRGKVEYYLAGELRWGIELVVKGRDLEPCHCRFAPGGKYFPLHPRDYVVVDLRPSKAWRGNKALRLEHRVTVVFSEDFSNCKFTFGLDDRVHINLSP